MSEVAEEIDYRQSPRKSTRTPKKKRRSESPVPPSPVKKTKQPAEEDHDSSFVPIESNESRSSEDVEESLVLPAVTSSGEVLFTAEEKVSDGVEEVYSSLPPDITIEQIVRVTRSAVQGEQLKITRNEKKQLRIVSLTALNATSEAETNYHTQMAVRCVVCERKIETGEMFLNFPDDLDRRRIWGNLLGFRYHEMLRIKSRMITVGSICTDHFAEECFRMYNFNKAAIEALGVPKNLSPVKSPMKRKPWSCTICSFASYSPFTTHEHMIKEHIEKSTSNSVEGNGYSCPFCRRCTYGYKTLSGFKRHMEAPPTDHCHLKRIYEIAREMCRSHHLEPSNHWQSWTDDNVALAYYGFVPPKKIVVKRKVVPASAPSTTTTDTVASDSAPSQKDSEASTSEAPPIKHTVKPNRSLIVSVQSSHSRLGGVMISRRDDRSNIDWDDGTPPPMLSPSKMRSMNQSIRHHSSSSSSPPQSSSQTQTLADMLALAAAPTVDDISQSISDSQSLTEPLDPSHLRKWMTTADIRVSKRQMEAAQARARLFGDSIPSDDLLPFPRYQSKNDPIRIQPSHQRLIHVAADVTSDVTNRRPLFIPSSTVPGRPRIAILRPKPSTLSSSSPSSSQ